MKQRDKCPACGHLDGWFEKRVLAYRQYFDAEGQPTHTVNGDPHGGIQKLCSNCHYDISLCLEV